MATANLYIVKDDKRNLNKNLTNKVKENVTIFYKDATEYISPVITLNYDESLKKVNYIYLSDKDRYYFVEKTLVTKGQKIVFTLLEDVRMSHKKQIKNLTCTIARNENLKNGYLHDSNYSVYAYEQVTCKMFPRGFDNNSIILMTVG